MQIKLTNGIFLKRKVLPKLIVKTLILLCCTTVFGFSSEILFSQNEKVSIKADKTMTIYEVLEIIGEQTECTFIYQSDIFKDVPKIAIKKGVVKVKTLLEQCLPPANFKLTVTNGNYYTITRVIPKPIKQGMIKVKGIITDMNDMPLVGVHVKVEGTQKGTISNFDGSYSIEVSSSGVLLFSALGFEQQAISVNNQSQINVKLKEDITELGKVMINTGYYSVKERERTGSISRVGSKDIALQPVVSPLQALQGRMPGVEINQTNNLPGAATTIQIRGRNSLRDDGNSPLYVIDGIPISSEEIDASGLYAISGLDPLSTLNVSNIESIEILKDADATSIYGSRGANGVVLITTKKASSRKSRVHFSAYTGVGEISQKMNVLNTFEYLEMRNEAFTNDNKIPTLSNAPDLLVWNQNSYTDWQDLLLSNSAFISDVQASISSGTPQTSFLFGMGYHNEDLVFPGDFGYKKLTGNLNLNHHSVDNKLNFTLSVNYGVDKHNSFEASNFINEAITLAPNAPELYNNQGDLNWENSTWVNPLSYLRKTQDINTNTLLSSMMVSYQIMPSLQAKVSVGYTNLLSIALDKNPISSNDPSVISENTASQRTTSRDSYIVEPQLVYNKNLGQGELDILFGATFQNSKNESSLLVGKGYTDESLLDNFAAANSVSVLTQDDREYAYNAVFGRVGYQWESKYFINLTGRRDGSSRFGPNNKFANFGAIGAAWIFTKEDFVKSALPFLSFGKFRGSYGTTGSDQIADYGYYDTYQPTNGVGGLYPTQLANPNYSWEVNKKMELSTELGFVGDRIMISANWYRNRSSNQLVGYTLPALTGFTSIQANLPATVENRGWELQLTTQNIQSDTFNWETSFNITIPKNELIEFPDIENTAYNNKYKVGASLNSALLYRSLGVDSTTGLYEMEDMDGDGRFDFNDRLIIQDMGRNYYGGLTNRLSYKNISLDFFFQFVNQKGRNHLAMFEAPGRSLGNQQTAVLDRWQMPGDVATTQQFSTSSTAYRTYTRARTSDLVLTDASFIRLKTLSLSYSFPSDLMEKVALQSGRIFLHGQNLFTLTDYEGLDPESALYGSISNLPPLRMFTFGVQLTF